MRQKTLVTICGAAIAGSMFLPWASLPVPLGSITPWALLKDIPAIADRDPAALGQLPPLLLAFLGSFVLGALAAVLAVVGWAPRLLALVTALLPIGIGGYIWFSARQEVEQLGVPLPSGSFGDVWDGISSVAGFGFWLYAGGAVLLLLTALLDPGDDY